MTDYRSFDISALCERLSEKKDTMIVYHVRSDADAIGSAFALREILISIGMKAYCACTDKIPDRLTFLTDGVQDSIAIERVPFDVERVISVDSASPAQLGEAYDRLCGKIDIMIDHHGLGTRYADGYIDPAASATGEIIFDIATELLKRGLISEISRRAVSCMYAAISSDTGCFKFANTTPKTHRTAAELLRMGAEAVEINHILYESKTLPQLRAEGVAAERLETYMGGRVACTTFPYSIKKELGLADENLETVIDVPRSLGGAEVAFAIRQPEDRGFFRVSMRSASDAWDVARICSHFGGGGHKRAAGCSLEAENIDEAKRMILSAIEG